MRNGPCPINRCRINSRFMLSLSSPESRTSSAGSGTGAFLPDSSSVSAGHALAARLALPHGIAFAGIPINAPASRSRYSQPVKRPEPPWYEGKLNQVARSVFPSNDQRLPQNRISCLKRARAGDLWFGTWFGLALSQRISFMPRGHLHFWGYRAAVQ